MTRPRHLLLASTLVTLSVSLAAATLPEQGNSRLGATEFTYRETVNKDNLWNISLGLMVADDVTQNQVMAAILRRNPDAFQQGSMFYLRKGVSLTIPSLSQIRTEDVAKADALFSHQELAWKEGRPPEEAILGLTSTDVSDKPSTKNTIQESTKNKKPATATLKSDNTRDETSEIAPPAGNGIIYGIGFAALLAGIYFFLSRRNFKTGGQSASNLSSETPSAQNETSSKDSNMSSHNLSKKRDELLVTRQLVSDNSQKKPLKQPLSKFGNDAEMKFKIAQAYLELNRQEDARVMLEDIVVEGSSALRNKAKKLLGR